MNLLLSSDEGVSLPKVGAHITCVNARPSSRGEQVLLYVRMEQVSILEQSSIHRPEQLSISEPVLIQWPRPIGVIDLIQDPGILGKRVQLVGVVFQRTSPTSTARRVSFKLADKSETEIMVTVWSYTEDEFSLLYTVPSEGTLVRVVGTVIENNKVFEIRANLVDVMSIVPSTSDEEYLLRLYRCAVTDSSAVTKSGASFIMNEAECVDSHSDDEDEDDDDESEDSMFTDNSQDEDESEVDEGMSDDGISLKAAVGLSSTWVEGYGWIDEYGNKLGEADDQSSLNEANDDQTGYAFSAGGSFREKLVNSQGMFPEDVHALPVIKRSVDIKAEEVERQRLEARHELHEPELFLPGLLPQWGGAEAEYELFPSLSKLPLLPRPSLVVGSRGRGGRGGRGGRAAYRGRGVENASTDSNLEKAKTVQHAQSSTHTRDGARREIRLNGTEWN